MDVQLIYAAAALLSALSAVLAWIAKLKWSQEFADSKNAQIEQLNSQIRQLQELTPMKIREYFLR